MSSITDSGARKYLNQQKEIKLQLAREQFLKSCFTDPRPTTPAPVAAVSPPQLSREERFAAAKKARSIRGSQEEDRKTWSNAMGKMFKDF
jgi:hypothetical protein